MGGINIHVNAGDTAEESYIHASGSIQFVIDEENTKKFGLSDGDLKNLVKEYFGKKPNDAFLHSPTPWNDLYKRYNWPQVKVVLVPTSAEILSLTSKPVIVASKIFKNDSTQTGTFDTSISQSVTNTSSSSWSYSNQISVGQKISYGISYLGTGGGGETSFSYSLTLGESNTESESVTVGTNDGVKVTLEPNESVEAILSASRGVLKARITYQAYLTGCTAINYSHSYKGHHFWALPITSVLKHSGKPYMMKVTEDMEVGYYSNSSIELLSAKGTLISRYSASDKPSNDESHEKAESSDITGLTIS
jgi:hypothetical protein